MNQHLLISAVPFSTADPSPLQVVKDAGISYVLNPFGRTLSEAEMLELVPGCRVIVAGTEPITASVMDRALELQLISRVGIGLDSVDLDAARKRGIRVSYTPDEPAPAVAELTIGLMIDLLRHISTSNLGLRGQNWDRPLGRRLSEVTVGLVGVGRIGKRVVKHLRGFGTRILAFDVAPDLDFGIKHELEWVDDPVRLFEKSDAISLHVPLTKQTHHLIDTAALRVMKKSAVLVNTARGGVVDEAALFNALKSGEISGAAMDVFDKEPYIGPLTEVNNCILTCHLGSCTVDCHTAMELKAVEEAVRFFKGEPLQGLIPSDAASFKREL